MVEITNEDNKSIFKPEKDLTGDYTEKLRTELMKELEKNDVELVIDLANVQLIDSTGLALLVAAQKSIREKDGNLTLININEGIFDLLKLTHLDRFFQLE